MFNNIDLFGELVKNLSFQDVLNFRKVSLLHRDFIDQVVDNIEETRFLSDHNIAVINKTFELLLDYQLNSNNLVKIPQFKFRWKRGRMSYKYNNIQILVNSKNRLTISGCKSHNEAKTELVKLFNLFRGYGINIELTELDKLIELSTLVRFVGNINHNRLEQHSSFQQLIYGDDLFYNKYHNGNIETYYVDFKQFYLTYNLIKEDIKIYSDDVRILSLSKKYVSIKHVETYHKLIYGAIVDVNVEVKEAFRK